jgi:hypothetical protein
MTAHWGLPDPAEAKGNPAEIALAFKDTYRMLNQRIGIFVSLPLRSLDQLSLQRKLREIGRMEGATARAAEPACETVAGSAYRRRMFGHGVFARCSGRLRHYGGEARWW